MGLKTDQHSDVCSPGKVSVVVYGIYCLRFMSLRQGAEHKSRAHHDDCLFAEKTYYYLYYYHHTKVSFPRYSCYATYQLHACNEIRQDTKDFLWSPSTRRTFIAL